MDKQLEWLENVLKNSKKVETGYMVSSIYAETPKDALERADIQKRVDISYLQSIYVCT